MHYSAIYRLFLKAKPSLNLLVVACSLISCSECVYFNNRACFESLQIKTMQRRVYAVFAAQAFLVSLVDWC